MEDRYSKRIQVEGSIIFAAETMIGEGRVIDVSLPGCLMEISESPRPGGYLRLKLSLPDGQPAISIPLAVVRWVKDNRIGIEFIRTSEKDALRLKRFIRSHCQNRSVSEWEGGIEILSAVGG
jgi:hypothetical protein